MKLPRVIPTIVAALSVNIVPTAVAAEVALSAACASGNTPHVVVMHGGALSGQLMKFANKRLDALEAILKKGEAAAGRGATAVEVVVFVIAEMENNGKFNAGRGSGPNQAGEKEMDASIMDGDTQKAGAVASVRKVKNPILAAWHVMEKTENVLFVGPAADKLLLGMGLEEASLQTDIPTSRLAAVQYEKPFGTVGAAVLDKCGHLAAGTSTGGIGSKIPGRVGDSPIIGAGTYANKTVAVSATGHGEFFIRYAVAYDIYARMAYGGQSLNAATEAAITNLTGLDAMAGLIAVDKDGNVSMPFNSQGMVRGVAGEKIEFRAQARK